jgi:hypothetical protein
VLAQVAEELLDVFRREVKDYPAAYQADRDDTLCLWQDAEVYTWMTEACDALARDTKLLVDVMSLDVEAGEAEVALPAHVLHINGARLVDAEVEVTAANANQRGFGRVDDYGRSLQHSMFSTSTGVPISYVRDYRARTLKLVPTPADDDTLELQCCVTIEDPMAEGEDLPFLEARDQRLLLHYMKWKAYEKHDAETEDLVRARKNEDAYRTGVRDREVEFRNLTRAAGCVQSDY